MSMLAFLLLQATAPTLSPEALDLGVRLARTTGLSAMAPLLIEQDLASLADEDASLTAAERERLLALGRAEAKTGVDRLMTALGTGYAAPLA